MIRPATRADLKDVLDFGMRRNTRLDPLTVDPEKFLTIKSGVHKMCAHVLCLNEIAEVHIICPRKHVIKSREMALELLKYLASLGFDHAITSVGLQFKTAHNMAIKLGFTARLVDDEQIIYGMPIWELRQRF